MFSIFLFAHRTTNCNDLGKGKHNFRCLLKVQFQEFLPLCQKHLNIFAAAFPLEAISRKSGTLVEANAISKLYQNNISFL